MDAFQIAESGADTTLKTLSFLTGTIEQANADRRKAIQYSADVSQQILQSSMATRQLEMNEYFKTKDLLMDQQKMDFYYEKFQYDKEKDAEDRQLKREEDDKRYGLNANLKNNASLAAKFSSDQDRQLAELEQIKNTYAKKIDELTKRTQDPRIQSLSPAARDTDPLFKQIKSYQDKLNDLEGDSLAMLGRKSALQDVGIAARNGIVLEVPKPILFDRVRGKSYESDAMPPPIDANLKDLPSQQPKVKTGYNLYNHPESIRDDDKIKEAEGDINYTFNYLKLNNQNQDKDKQTNPVLAWSSPHYQTDEHRLAMQALQARERNKALKNATISASKEYLSSYGGENKFDSNKIKVDKHSLESAGFNEDQINEIEFQAMQAATKAKVDGEPSDGVGFRQRMDSILFPRTADQIDPPPLSGPLTAQLPGSAFKREKKSFDNLNDAELESELAQLRKADEVEQDFSRSGLSEANVDGSYVTFKPSAYDKKDVSTLSRKEKIDELNKYYSRAKYARRSIGQ